MTFYQELQLNQEGSKALIRSVSGRREKLHHTAIYMCKIAITMMFCMCFVMVYGQIFGQENSIVGVVILLFLMVFKNADFGIDRKDSQLVLVLVFGILLIGPKLANLTGPIVGMLINAAAIFVLVFLSCHNLLMSNHSTVVLGYLLLYGYDVSGTAFTVRIGALAVGAALTMIVFYRGHKNKVYKRTIRDLFREIDLKSSRTRWQIALTLGIASVMAAAEILHLPRFMWAGIAVMSVMLPFENDSKKRSDARIPGNIIGGILFLLLYLWLSPSFLAFESLMTEYLPISAEKLQEYAKFDEKTKRYVWVPLGCGNYAPNFFGTSVPEVAAVKENQDGTITLTVNAVCDMVLCDDALITHDLTVKFKEDRNNVLEYQYRVR